MRILRKTTKKLKITALTLSVLMLLTGILSPDKGFWPGSLAEAAETPEMVYFGDAGAEAVLENLHYSDVAGSNVWSKEAIYESGALGITNGIGSTYKSFGRTVPLTKQEAIAIAFRAADREAEAQQLGIAINNARAAADKKTDTQEIWYDGFLQLASNESLISAQDLADAFNTDQTTLTDVSFKRNAPAQRQEMAYWLAMTLNIQPAAKQQELYNYSDWKSIDTEKLHYIEAIVQRGIMSGSGSRINPIQAITREQGAQIVKNAESEVLEALKYTKSSGIIDGISLTKDFSGDISVSGKNIKVSNINGRSVSILTAVPGGTASGIKNENNGTPSVPVKKELVVYKNGVIGNSSLLKNGDRIQYITDIEKTVKFITVLSNINDVKYLAVQVNSIDSADMLLNVTKLFDMYYPDLNSIADDISFTEQIYEKTTYRIDTAAVITVNGVKSEMVDIMDDITAILTIGSNNIIKEIQCVDLGINAEARRIVRGIVEENNPGLGYITLYNEDGSGTGSVSAAALRSYSYVDQSSTEIFRNQKVADADSIQSGDTAYIKLDKNGDIVSISAVDNYQTRYARVVSKLPTEILVEFNDGTQQLLTTGNDVVVIMDKQLVGLSALKDGDRVRLLLNENAKTNDLREITIEGNEHYISNIYKGTITKIDDISDKITVMGLQYFYKGNWERTDCKGFSTIPLAEEYSIHSGGALLDIEDANRLLNYNEAYIAVEKDYGGEEKAVALSYRNSLDTRVPVATDSITGVVSGAGNFIISRENKKVNYSDGSIVVKYGRLVSGSSLANDDKAYMTLDREYSTGNYFAAVVKVDELLVENGLSLYRGRISEINDNQNFTVESFSQLQGTDWKYSNTPKSFDITFTTRVLNDEGVLNVRDFIGYGEDSYIERTVYVLAEGSEALLISTAPYGTANIKGTVYATDGEKLDLRNVQLYNPTAYMWTGSANASVNILANSVVIKNNKVINGADIKKGDSVKVIKKDTELTGEGYIIFVE